MNEKPAVLGRLRKIEQRTPGLPSLKDLRNFETFDVEFSAAGLVLRKTYYTHQNDVDESIQKVYDESGRHLRTLGFGDKGELTNITEIEYDSSGRSIGWVERDLSGATMRHGIDHYDEDLLASSTIVLAHGNRRITVFEYVGEIRSKSVTRQYNQCRDLTEQWISHYYPDGRLRETFGLTSEGKSLGDGRYIYEYDASGRESRTLGFNEFSDENVPNSVSVYEYMLDPMGNWIERQHHHRFRNDSCWRTEVSKRKVMYYEDE